MPKIVEVPGVGNVEFPDTMPDDQVAGAIRANMQRPADKGDVAGTKAFLDTKYGHLSQETPAPTNNVGDFLRGAGNAVSGMVEMGKRMLTPPQDTRGKIAAGIAGPLGPLVSDMIGTHVETGKKAVSAAKQGDVSSVLGYGLATVIPGAGPMAAAAGEKMGEGKFAEAGGELATNLLLGKATTKAGRAELAAPVKSGVALVKRGGTAAAKTTGLLKEPTPVEGITKALKPTATNTEFPKTLERALPEIKASEAELGKPISGVNDMLDAVKVAKKRVWSQIEEIRGPQAQRMIDGSPVADAMVKAIPTKLKLENPKAAAAMIDQAEVYRKPFQIQDLEEILKTSNAELDSYYGKYPTAKRTALGGNPDTAQLHAQAKALRDTIYGELDSMGEGAAPRELKQRYGSLLNVEHELYRRQNVAARQAPESLSQQLGKWHAAGQTARGAFRVLHGDMGGAADIAGAMASRKMADFLKEQNTSDALIKNTFEKYDQAPTPVQYTPQPIRGLLGPGAHRMPAGPDPSGTVRDAPGPTVLHQDPAWVRKQKLLPAPEKPALVTPPPADPSGDYSYTGTYPEKVRPGMPAKLLAAPKEAPAAQAVVEAKPTATPTTEQTKAKLQSKPREIVQPKWKEADSGSSGKHWKMEDDSKDFAGIVLGGIGKFDAKVMFRKPIGGTKTVTGTFASPEAARKWVKSEYNKWQKDR